MGVLAPQARQCLNLMPRSLMISVSGFLHSGQSTKSLTYISTFSLTLDELSFVLRIRRSPSTEPGAASSLSRNLPKCSAGLRIWEAMAARFVMMVFFPEIWPWTFGISKRSPLEVAILRFLYALSNSCS